MRGISAVIVVVLILMITVTLASAAYVWFKSFYSTATAAGGAEAERFTTTGKSLMKIEGKTDKIYIRNIGDTNLSGFAVYMNDIPIDYEIDKETLAPGQVAEIIPNLTYYTEGSKVKITTAQGLVSETAYEISFYDDFSAYSAGSDGSPTWSPVSGTWTVENGEYSGTDGESLGTETFDNFIFEAKVKMEDAVGTDSYEGIGIRIGSGYHFKYYNDGSLKLEKEGYYGIEVLFPIAPSPTEWKTIKIIAGPPFDDPDDAAHSPKTNIQVYIDGTLFSDNIDEKQIINCGIVCGSCFRCLVGVKCLCPCGGCPINYKCASWEVCDEYSIYKSGYISLEASGAHVHFDDVKITRT